MFQLMPLPSQNPHHLLPHLNPDWFLSFWYWLTQVVREKSHLMDVVVVVDIAF